MRVESIALYSNDVQIISFNMTGPDPRNPYTIKTLNGLDAQEIVPQYYSSGVSGEKFNELVLQPREITMRIDLKPNYRLGQHPADLRGKLLKAIASSRNGQIQLRFLEGGICWGAIKGFVTKFEAPTTSRDTEVQFTMRCDDPIIRSLTVTNQTDLDDLDDLHPVIIDPISTSPHGFKFKITMTSPAGAFGIYDYNGGTTDWYWRSDYDYEAGDEIYFSSEFGDKYLYVVRSAVTTQLMDTLIPNSLWPILFPGENAFETFYNDFTWDELYWYETHWGI